MPRSSVTAFDEPLLVVGSGLAGALLALRAAPSAPVVLVTKGELGAGSTRAAQGGIAAAMAADDTPGAHLADTVAAGAGLVDEPAARRLVAEGPARVAELVALGVGFDLEGVGPGPRRLALAREGAHSAARVAHAGGDATGAHVVRALVAALRADPRIEVVEGERALAVTVAEGRATGLRTRDRAGRERHRGGRAVALATGGAGGLYRFSTNPPGATADGPALAAAAGAALADLELVQFHPTALALGDSPRALVSEAVRGEGAVLRDRRGRRFMPDVHPLAELGPRDVVARAIFARAAEDGVPVTLDLRHLDAEVVRARFPTVAAACAAHGLDLARDRIPVTPAAHYAIGGVLADLDGRTTLPGLLAVGECAATGVHGANRLASNSLLEAAVMGVGAARVLSAPDPLAGWPEGPVGPASGPPAASLGDTAATREAIAQAMWEGVGVERDAAGLAGATRALASLAAADDPEVESLRAVALATVAAAAARAESRGAHFRRDHPEPDPRQARRVAWVGEVPHPLPLAGAPAPRRRVLAKEGV